MEFYVLVAASPGFALRAEPVGALALGTLVRYFIAVTFPMFVVV